ncbi:MAG: L-glyceraldehyde 3-phosphate reductase [candidate division KSB1 bacterium]|nr:L-glyceraldehyde 3-phosphate reductase [candidate division KSB1 bacterium]MDZ7319839.1 L-glyceraldehyde 3-phosphate reductase [candidate division KSB1 bacterium]
MSYIPSAQRYENMLYQRCGRSGLKLPIISLGLWHNFGGVDTFENCRKIIWQAFDAGITHFDLANNYGPPPGSAEETFGRILKMDLQSYRDELIISTKAGYYMWPGPYGEWGSKKYLIASLDQSLKRLGMDYVDIFYSHRFDPETPLEETMEALYQAVQQGKALYAGISNYPPTATARAAQILNDFGLHCLIHQPPYSMLNRTIETGLLEVLEEKGIGCIVFSPLAQGLLSDRYLQGIPADSRAEKPHGFLQRDAITEPLLTRLRKLNQLAQQRGQSLAQMAIAWALRDRRVTSAVIGVSRTEQLQNNLATLKNLRFTTDELTEIDTILSDDHPNNA